MRKNQKGFEHIFLLIVIVLVGIGGIGYFAVKNGQIKTTSQKANLISPSPTTKDNASDWKTYRFERNYKNGYLGFEIKHPQEWKVLENLEEGGTISFFEKNKNEAVFLISWLNPDLIYDIEDLCIKGFCETVDNFQNGSRILRDAGL